MRKNLLLLFMLIVCFANAQDTNNKPFKVYEDSLKVFGKVITNDTLEQNRVVANYKLIKTLVNSLKQSNSYAYPFDSLANIVSVIKSDDNKFRVFSWFMMSDDGTFRFYGALQMNNPKKLELYPFTDSFARMESPEDSTLNPKKWFGAVYYKIIPVNAQNKQVPYYTLLGWKGSNRQSTKKVIDVLWFDEGKPVFGLPVFEGSKKEDKIKNRVVFSYTSEVSLLLNYDKEKGMIVFDHLAPPNDKVKNMPGLWGPDLSYDAYKFKNGKWILQENVNLKNLPNASDEDLGNSNEAGVMQNGK
ncbi:MAG: hypothetical protein EAZ15_06855 [Sphingobacteriales bacterium]|nr:MAG: hypothetical protein EAZ15_06855 [Sphingobacteriales bacterium]